MSRNPALKAFQEKLQKDNFGMTKDEAAKAGICLSCQKPIDLSQMAEIDVKEYGISGFCPQCFDELAADPDDLGSSSKQVTDGSKQATDEASQATFDDLETTSPEEGITSDDDDYH